jgi:drug/metabolite transporter (DMT)-like permease
MSLRQMLLIGVASVFWGIWAFLNKYCQGYVSSFQALLIVWTMSSLLVPYGIVKTYGEPWSLKGVALAAAGAACGIVANASNMYALKEGSGGTVTALSGSYPLFAFVLCSMFLGEHLTAIKLCGVVGIVVGTALVSR